MRTKIVLASLLLTVAGVVSAWAQAGMIVWKNGKPVGFRVNEVDSVQFVSNAAMFTSSDYVDLGLPSGTLWATCNIGASSPEEFGEYFAWGETYPKKEYTARNYVFADSVFTENGFEYVFSVTKYCTDSRYGTIDNKIELEPIDDAATVNWGSDWQMPSKEQFEELINESYTTTTWTTLNGVNGIFIRSKRNGNSVFFPAAGYYGSYVDVTRTDAGIRGGYYTRSNTLEYNLEGLNLVNPIVVDYFFFNDFETDTPFHLGTTFYLRFTGLSIRPVFKGTMPSPTSVSVSQIVLSDASLNIEVNEKKNLTATVLPEDASNKNLEWESSDEDVAEVDAEGQVTGKGVGTCFIVCQATDNSGIYAQCQITVSSNNSSSDGVTNPLDGHEWVDLGLPSGTLWATCNVGADSPGDYGDYYAWGETQTKDSLSWSNYKYCNGSSKTLTKYCTESNYGYNGFTDGLTELLPEDDAATANWGSNWQMPSASQWEELYDNSNTTITEQTQNGVYGWKITSKNNGNSFFLPAAGMIGSSSDVAFAGENGSYWSRTCSYSYSCFSLYFYGYKNVFRIDEYGTRYSGFSVRPVVKLTSSGTTSTLGLVTKIELSETSLTLQIGQTDTLSATVLPENAVNKAVTWESSNTDVCIVDNEGKVTAIGNGTCYVICHATDDSGVSAYCKVTVGNINSSHEWVDLGLPSGTLWATCNVGANSPEDYGDYFAWGETEPKSDYTWETYMYYNTSYEMITKYCTNSSRGSIDNITELEPEDDAATVNWGSDWQTPSIEQMKELLNTIYTTRSWTTMNGVKGRMIVSKSNGNRIFLPAAGFCNGTSLTKAGSGGRYWTRSLNEDDSRYGRRMSFDSDGIDMGIYLRYRGRSVRPVRVKK